MEKLTLYKYERAPGKVTITPRRQLGPHTLMVRLIAGEGKMLTNDNGQTLLSCVDVENIEGWVEIDLPQPEETNKEI